MIAIGLGVFCADDVALGRSSAASARTWNRYTGIEALLLAV
jgi:hypothetical protein